MPINKIPQSAFSNDDMIVNTFTATAGQTAFTLTKQVSVNSVLVHINDVIQQPTVDYTVSGTTLTLTAGATVGDDVRVRILSENPLGVSGGGGGGGSSSLIIQDEGSALSTAATTLNFVGSGVTATGTGGLKTITISGGSSGGIALTDLSVAAENTPAGNGAITYNNSNGQFSYTPPVLNGLTATGDTDFGSNKITYSNHYAQLSDLPSASNYHGMFAHVHATGAGYYAHGGNWIRLAEYTQLKTNLGSLDDVSSASASTGQVLKWDGSQWAPGSDLTASGGSGIALSDLSASTALASGSGSLAYNNSTGVFTFTPPDLSSYAQSSSVPYVALPPEQVFAVTASGSSAYNFSGAATGNNPTLNLNRGKTYRFDVNASGHPFQIRVSSGGSNYTDGVENAGTQSGSVYFTVPDDAPATLVYQCTVHSAMVGTINVKGYAFGDFSSGLTTSHQDFHIRGSGIYVGNDADPAIIHAGTDITLSADTSLNFVSDANDTADDAAAGNITFGSGSYVNTDANKDFTFDQYTNSANPTDGYTPRNVFGKFDGLGRFTLPAQPGFTATTSANYARAGDNTQLDPSWSVKHNVGSHFDSTSSRFTAPVAGRYLLSFNITHTFSGNTSIGDAWSVMPQVNSSDYTNYQGYYGDGGLETGKEGTHNWSAVITLAANDVVQLVTKGTTATGITFMTGSTWTMQLIA